MTALFRPEAVDGQRESWLGSVQLIRPLPLTLLTWFMAGVAALVVGYLAVGEYTRKAHLSGVLVADPDRIRLAPPQAATVLESYAREGQVVRQGDLLFVLSVDGATRGADAQAAVRQSLAVQQRRRAEPTQESRDDDARRYIAVHAPLDGVLTAVTAEPGQSVSPAAALANLAPTQGRLQAQLYAPSSAIGWLRPQQLVVLRYPAFPYQDYGHYSGRVSRVSRTPLQASAWAGLSPAAATRFGAGAASGEPNAGEQYYQVTVALDEQAVAARGYAQPLVAGMQIEAEVRLERRRLIEWLFGPLLGGSGV